VKFDNAIREKHLTVDAAKVKLEGSAGVLRGIRGAALLAGGGADEK